MGTSSKIALMLDIETIGKSPYAPILSVGAVAFTKSVIIDQKEWYLDVDQQIAQGRKVDFSTLSWWMLKTDEKAKNIFKEKFRTSIGFFCGEFNQFVRAKCGDDFTVWGNGASFDIPIIETLLGKNTGQEPPWKFWKIRCYRTLKNMHKLEEFSEGTKHSALDDALNQAKALQAFFTKHPELEG
jgi:exodeoxyribonuclease VIII